MSYLYLFKILIIYLFIIVVPEIKSENIYDNKGCMVKQYEYALLYNNDIGLYQIHGLWPDSLCDTVENYECIFKNYDKEYLDDVDYPKYPEYCKNVTFDINKLNPIIDELEINWYPSNNRSSQFNLMVHEYKKHGSCAPYDELTYFNKSLCLYFNLDLSVCTGPQCLFNVSDYSNICDIDSCY